MWFWSRAFKNLLHLGSSSSSRTASNLEVLSLQWSRTPWTEEELGNSEVPEEAALLIEEARRRIVESHSGNAVEKFQSDDLRPIEAMSIEEFFNWETFKL